jgi:hypothetical protein
MKVVESFSNNILMQLTCVSINMYTLEPQWFKNRQNHHMWYKIVNDWLESTISILMKWCIKTSHIKMMCCKNIKYLCKQYIKVTLQMHLETSLIVCQCVLLRGVQINLNPHAYDLLCYLKTLNLITTPLDHIWIVLTINDMKMLILWHLIRKQSSIMFFL